MDHVGRPPGSTEAFVVGHRPPRPGVPVCLGAEDVERWNFFENAPLFGLPELPDDIRLPEEPFRKFNWFDFALERLPDGPPDAFQLSGPGTPEQEAASREAMERVEAGFPRLSIHHREVIQLTTLHELSHAAVAERLGVSEGAVKVRLHRAREALRGLLLERDSSAPCTPRLALARGRSGLIGSSRQGARSG